MPISQELLKIIACPECKAHLDYSREKDNLTCTKCKKIYKIKGDIPILL